MNEKDKEIFEEILCQRIRKLTEDEMEHRLHVNKILFLNTFTLLLLTIAIFLK